MVSATTLPVNDLRQSAKSGEPESEAVADDSAPCDPNLAALIDAWPTLPEAVRRQVVALVRAATEADR